MASVDLLLHMHAQTNVNYDDKKGTIMCVNMLQIPRVGLQYSMFDEQ